jgi:hypothetical protein
MKTSGLVKTAISTASGGLRYVNDRHARVTNVPAEYI